jgi:hypothetical protein
MTCCVTLLYSHRQCRLTHTSSGRVGALTNESVCGIRVREKYTQYIQMLIAVIAPDGTLLGVFTSQVDAHLVAKPAGATMWRCRPNSQECSVVVHTPIKFADDTASAEDF